MILLSAKNNQAQLTTQLVLTLGSPATTLLKVGTGGGASIGVLGHGGIGVKGEGGTAGVRGEGGTIGLDGEGSIGVRGTATSQEGVQGFSNSGVGVSGSSKSDAGVLGSSETGIGVRGSVGLSPFPVPSNVGVLGECQTGIGVRGHASSATGVLGRSISSNGVKGVSDSKPGVRGTSQSGSGVFGTSGSSPGAIGFSGSGAGLAGLSLNGTGLWAKGETSGLAAQLEGNVVITGDLTVAGANFKSAAVKFPDGTLHRMYCQEAPEPWFEDFNEAQLVKGRAEVRIDPDFAKTVDLSQKYHVFLQPLDTKIKGLAVVARLADRFIVEDQAGGAEGAFSYRLVARRLGTRATRFEVVNLPATIPLEVFRSQDDEGVIAPGGR